MNRRRQFSLPVLGGSSLLIIFAVLCLTVFALLGLSTVRAGQQLSDAGAQSVSDYYRADCAAEEIFARLRGGELPDGVTETDGVYSYQCTISDTQILRVSLRRDGEDWTVLQWQAVSSTQWEADGTLDLWDGNKT